MFFTWLIKYPKKSDKIVLNCPKYPKKITEKLEGILFKKATLLFIVKWNLQSFWEMVVIIMKEGEFFSDNVRILCALLKKKKKEEEEK